MTAPRLPAIPDRTVSIVQYGAVGDGLTLNTAAFAKAIDACAKSGGGRVAVPPGIWLTGPIRLAANIELHLEAGSVILFSRRLEDYPLMSGEGARRRAVSPIMAIGVENIAITGQGIIDGSGDAWRPVKKEKMTPSQWSALVASGGVLNAQGNLWTPVRGSDAIRPNMVLISECKRVLLDGPTFENSPAWNIHPLLSEDVTIRNVTVLNPWYAQNGDGLDIDACRRVVVYNSHFDVGDDAICIKSGAGEAARRRGRASEEIVISNDTVYHGHGGVTIGSEMSGGVRNVYVDKCVFLGTDLGLRFKSARGRGGVVENLYYNNIYMKTIATDAIGFTMSYGGGAPEDGDAGLDSKAPIPPVDEGTPRFRNIHFTNIVCTGAKRAVYLTGLPEMPIEGVEFNNVTISANAGFETLNAKGVRVTGSRILPTKGSVFQLGNSVDVSIEKSAGPKGADTFLTLSGGKTGNIRLMNSAVSEAKKDIELRDGARADAVVR